MSFLRWKNLHTVSQNSVTDPWQSIMQLDRDCSFAENSGSQVCSQYRVVAHFCLIPTAVWITPAKDHLTVEPSLMALLHTPLARGHPKHLSWSFTVTLQFKCLLFRCSGNIYCLYILVDKSNKHKTVTCVHNLMFFIAASIPHTNIHLTY